jgi:hypothetical protein
MVGVQVDVKIFKTVLKKALPDVNKKFNDLNFDSMFFSLNWFVCLFSDKLVENVIPNLFKTYHRYL